MKIKVSSCTWQYIILPVMIAVIFFAAMMISNYCHNQAVGKEAFAGFHAHGEIGSVIEND